jgi:hypothetical protein
MGWAQEFSKTVTLQITEISETDITFRCRSNSTPCPCTNTVSRPIYHKTDNDFASKLINSNTESKQNLQSDVFKHCHDNERRFDVPNK